MRKLRYGAAMSLDGFIARKDGTYDWIVSEPAIDFDAMFARYDTLVMGRATYEVIRSEDMGGRTKGMKQYVVSTSLRPEDAPDATVVNRDVEGVVRSLKSAPGKDIWLFGGGILFRHLLDARLVDELEVAVIPVLLGEGIPFLAPGSSSPPLLLKTSRTYPSGIVMLTYGISN